MLRVMALAIFLTVGGAGRARAGDLGDGPDLGQPPAPGEHRKEPDEPPIASIDRRGQAPSGGCAIGGVGASDGVNLALVSLAGLATVWGLRRRRAL